MLVRLERVGLVDDEAFARQFAEHRFGSRGEGSRAVMHGLRAAGIASSLAETVAQDVQGDDEERAADSRENRTAIRSALPGAGSTATMPCAPSISIVRA